MARNIFYKQNYPSIIWFSVMGFRKKAKPQKLTCLSSIFQWLYEYTKCKYADLPLIRQTTQGLETHIGPSWSSSSSQERWLNRGLNKKEGIHTTCWCKQQILVFFWCCMWKRVEIYCKERTYRIYIMTPSDHMSHDLSYFSGPRTSGAADRKQGKEM